MKSEQIERCRQALEALYAPPMTEQERAEHSRRVAEEMARAERRRQPSPQLELGE